MLRIADAISLPNTPVGLVRSQGKQATYKELNEFLRKNPSPIQKLTYLTLGGLITALVGALVSLFSKSQNVLGSLLALVGLGITSAGFCFSPCYSLEPSENTKKENNNPKNEAVNPDKDTSGNEEAKVTGVQKSDDISKHTSDELILILLNKVKDKKFTAKVRAEAAIELGKKKVQEAVIPLITCLKDKFKSVVEASISALGKIGGMDAFHALRKFLKDDTISKPLRIKVTNAMKEILKNGN